VTRGHRRHARSARAPRGVSGPLGDRDIGAGQQQLHQNETAVLGQVAWDGAGLLLEVDRFGRVAGAGESVELAVEVLLGGQDRAYPRSTR
jgi:hypothetical protein